MYQLEVDEERKLVSIRMDVEDGKAVEHLDVENVHELIRELIKIIEKLDDSMCYEYHSTKRGLGGIEDDIR